MPPYTNFPNGITSEGLPVLTSANIPDGQVIFPLALPGDGNITSPSGWIGINNGNPLSPLHIGGLEGTPQSGIAVGRNIGWLADADGHGISTVENFTTIGRAYAAYDDQGIMSGTGNYNHRVSFQARPIISNIGIMTRVSHFDSLLDTTAGTHVTHARLFYAQDDRAVVSGTVDNVTALYIDRFDPTKATNGVWSIRQVGNDIPAWFDGMIGMGMQAPVAQINIGGARSWSSWTNTSRMLAVNATTLTDTDGTGTINQRVTALSLGQSTLAAANAETITNAMTLFIQGPPQPGTNVTITNQWATWIAAGKSYFGDGFNVGSATVFGGMATIAGSLSAPSWTTVGKYLTVIGAGVLTDTSSAASATITQRAVNSLGITNLAASNAITISNAHTLYISGPPAAGANTTITKAWAIYAANGDNFFGGAVVANAVPIPAGGTIGAGYLFSTVANFGIFFGSGAPTLSAAKGSLYLRSDGSGTGDRAYINTNGTTTWTPLTTAA